MITATFKNKETYNTVTDEVWQWDYGQILQIEGLDLPTAIEVDFSTDSTGDGSSLMVIGTTFDSLTTVNIPDEMFAKKKIRNYMVYAFVFVTDETSGETMHRIDIPVLTRPNREDYAQPNESDPWGSIVGTVSEAANKATTAADKAQEILDLVEAAYGNFKSVTISKDEETGVTTLTITGDDGVTETATINDGLSAYEVAVKNGFTGSEQQWLDSLKGEKGDPGGFEGIEYDEETETVWLV